MVVHTRRRGVSYRLGWGGGGRGEGAGRGEAMVIWARGMHAGDFGTLGFKLRFKLTQNGAGTVCMCVCVGCICVYAYK